MKYLNIPISDMLKERLDKYSKSSGILQKKIIELALLEYLKRKVK